MKPTIVAAAALASGVAMGGVAQAQVAGSLRIGGVRAAGPAEVAADNRALAARIRAAAHESALERARLAGLAPGMVVRNARGQRVGVVSRIVRTGGTIRSVTVTAADGPRRIAFSPAVLSVSGDVVVASQFAAR